MQPFREKNAYREIVIYAEVVERGTRKMSIKGSVSEPPSGIALFFVFPKSPLWGIWHFRHPLKK